MRFWGVCGSSVCRQLCCFGKVEDMDSLIYERLTEFVDKMYRIDDERIYRNFFLSMGIYPIMDKESEFQKALG